MLLATEDAGGGIGGRCLGRVEGHVWKWSRREFVGDHDRVDDFERLDAGSLA